MASFPTASESDVQDILNTQAPSSAIDQALSAAERVVEDQLTSKGYPDDTLTQMHGYAAAHLLHTYERQHESLKTGPVTEQVLGEYTTGWGGTPPGQTLLALDHKGVLGDADGGGAQRPGFRISAQG